MKISVIMAARNSESTIGQAVESFLEQSHKEKELIVIDGGSSDRTCSIVNSFHSPLVKISSQADRGIYDGMNKGLSHVTGDAFGCLNSDDKYTNENALSLVAKALERVDIVSGVLRFVREHDGSAPVRIWCPQRHSEGAFKLGYSLPHPATYARRRVLDKVGSFSLQYRCASDYDWLLRALEIEKFSHDVLSEPLVDMRLGGESTSGVAAIIKNSRELLAVRQHRLESGFVDRALFLNLWIKLGQITSLPARGIWGRK